MPDDLPYLTLGLDGETFAIAIRHVHEILDLQPISGLPHAPDFLLGMTDVRGAAYPVVDLRRKLGLAPAAATPQTRIVICNLPVDGATTCIGFVADRVFEVTVLDDPALDARPEVGGRWRSDYIAGIGRRNGAFVIVFDLERLMRYDATLLAPTAAAA